MRSILFLYAFLGCLTLSSQDGISYLDKFSNDFGVQFAFDPQQIALLETTSEWSKIDNKKQLKQLLSASSIQIAEIADDRWLLRKAEIVPKQTTYIRGQVSETDNQPLVSALIYTNGGEYAALTDEVGQFILEIPTETEYEVCCQYLGFEVQCVPNSAFLSFELKPQSIMIDDVKISSKTVKFQISVLGDGEVLRIRNSPLNKSVLGSDVLRTVQLLSGVDATNDLSAAMVVRGSSSLQSLVTLDGIPVYNPESAFGMFSVLNPLVVTKSTLYKNTMPLEYGEFTGGYLACEGLSKLEDRLRLNIDINTLQSSAAIQVPVGKKSQISGAFRRSNGRISNRQYYSTLQSNYKNNARVQELFDRPESLETSLENQFGDAYLNFSSEGKKDRFYSFSLLGNRDVSGTGYQGEYLSKIGENNVLVNVNEDYIQQKSKQNMGLSFNYLKKYKSGSEFRIMYYGSAYTLEDVIETNITFSRGKNSKNNEYKSEILNNVRDTNLKLQFQTSTKEKWSYKAGVDLRRISTDFNFIAKDVSTFRQDLQVPILTPYGGVIYNYKGVIVANIGVRAAIIPVDNPVSFASPRASLKLRLNDYLALKSSASVSQQFFRPVELERLLGQSTAANIVATGRSIPVLTSNQATLGIQYQRSGFKLNGDFYVRRNDGILEQVLSMPGLQVGETEVFGNNSYELFQGTNHVAGFDLTSSLELGGFFGLLSYTYSKSEDRFPKLFNEQPLVDQNNRLHQLNLFNSYTHNSWTFSTTYVYGSGVFALDRSAIGRNVNRGNIDPSALFTQLPAYNRFDISATYKVTTKRGDFHFDLGILNVMDNNNVNSELYIYNLSEENQTALGAAQVELLGRIWTVGVRFSL